MIGSKHLVEADLTINQILVETANKRSQLGQAQLWLIIYIWGKCLFLYLEGGIKPPLIDIHQNQFWALLKHLDKQRQFIDILDSATCIIKRIVGIDDGALYLHDS